MITDAISPVPLPHPPAPTPADQQLKHPSFDYATTLAVPYSGREFGYPISP